MRDLKPSVAEYAVYDTVVDGLAMRVQPSGAKSWIWRRAVANGIANRTTLGGFPATSTERAKAAVTVPRPRYCVRRASADAKLPQALHAL